MKNLMLPTWVMSSILATVTSMPTLALLIDTYVLAGEPQAKTLVVKPQDWGYPDREARTPWMYRRT